MALTRKFLSAMGIEEDKIDQIIEAHSTTVNALKEERDAYKVDAQKLPEIQKELNETKANIKDPSKDAYKVKYDALKEEFDDYKKGVEEGKVRARKEEAYKNLLKKAGISEKRIDAVLRVSDVDGIEVDADGNAINSQSLLEEIKKEWADFITTEKVEGTKVPTPPENKGGTNFEGMSLAEKMAYVNEHGKDEVAKAWFDNPVKNKE